MSANDASMKHGRSTSDSDSEVPVDEKMPPGKKTHLMNRGEEITTAADDDDEQDIIVTDTHRYEDVVDSLAFVDKTKYIRSIFQVKGKARDRKVTAKMLLFAAPFRCGKSTNMDMVRKFLSHKVDGSGRPKINVIWKDKTGWEEQQEQTASFKLFKKLQIYQCHHNPHHTEDECKHGECDDRNFFYENCGKHIVVFFNLQDVVCENLDDLMDSLKVCLKYAFLEHEYLNKSDFLNDQDKDSISMYISRKYRENLKPVDVSDGLKCLVQYLIKHFENVGRKQETGSSPSIEPRVFVMVEEYDAPISLLLGKKNVNEDYIGKVMNTIGGIVGCVLKDNPNVIGGLVNACLNIEGALSQHANNVKTVVFLEDALFAGYCGFTKDEVDKLLQKNAFKNVDKALMEDYYNGYHVLGQPEQKVYNTYSIVNHLKNEWIKMRKVHRKSPEKGAIQPKHYYVNRGAIKLEKMLAIDEIRGCILDMIQGAEIELPYVKDKLSVHEIFALKELLNNSSGGAEEETDFSLFFNYLKHRGYLFAKERENEMMTLTIPNDEIVSVLREKLWSSTFYKQKYHVMPSLYVNALLQLNADNESENTVKVLAESIMNMFPTEVLPKRHDELKGILFTYAFESRKFSKVESEPYVVPGRKFQCDLKIWRRDGVGIVLEIASGVKNEVEALQQIFANRYCESLDKKEGCKGKIYIGLLYDYVKGGTKICAYATGGKTVTSQCPTMGLISVESVKRD